MKTKPIYNLQTRNNSAARVRRLVAYTKNRKRRAGEIRTPFHFRVLRCVATIANCLIPIVAPQSLLCGRITDTRRCRHRRMYTGNPQSSGNTLLSSASGTHTLKKPNSVSTITRTMSRSCRLSHYFIDGALKIITVRCIVPSALMPFIIRLLLPWTRRPRSFVEHFHLYNY